MARANKMPFTVCVNAAGCIPDSDSYPYTVYGLNEASQALAEELAISFDCDDVRYGEILTQAQHELEVYGGTSVPLEGTYALHVMPEEANR